MGMYEPPRVVSWQKVVGACATVPPDCCGSFLGDPYHVIGGLSGLSAQYISNRHKSTQYSNLYCATSSRDDSICYGTKQSDRVNLFICNLRNSGGSDE